MNIFGAGGHTKVIIDSCQSLGIAVDIIFDENPEIKTLLGIPVLSQLKDLGAFSGPWIIGIGNNKIRKKKSETISQSFGTVIHPSAIVSLFASIGQGTAVFQGAIIQASVKIGNHCIVNTKASIDHDSIVGDFVHIGPGTTICGGVTLEEGVFIGAGATIIPGITIGKWAVIGAGSVVISDIPPYSTSFGVPNKIVKKEHEK